MEVMDEIAIEKYAAYKDSGVEWLGKIPEHWGIIRFKYLFDERNERSYNGEEDLLSVSQYTGVTKKSENVDEGELLTNASTLEGYKKVYEGDLVSNIMLAWNGSLGFSPYNGITSPAYSVYRLKIENNKAYYHYLVRSEIYKAEFKRNSSGVIESRLRLYSDDFYRIPSLHPPKEEQTAIARFLDTKTALIDKAIAIKEKQIELLKERQQILIHRAVTRGLNPNVKFKDSGVEWIGEIPESWNFTKLGYCIDILSGYAFPSNGFSNESGIKLLRGVNVYLGCTRWDDVVFWPEDKLQGLDEYFLKEGDIVFGMDRPLISGGMRVAKIRAEDLPCILLQRVTRIRAKRGLHKDYLLLILGTKAFTDYFTPILSGVSVPHISPNQIQSFKIGIPDLETQKIILSFIDNQSKTILKAISIKEVEIKKLREYQVSLINSAVTGKIKVC